MTPFKHPRAAAAISVAAAALIGAGGGAATYAVLDTDGTTTIREVPVESGEPAAATTSIADVEDRIRDVVENGMPQRFGFRGDGPGAAFAPPAAPTA